MELYKLIATINNIPSSFTMAYLPENFEGVKISQKFSFVNPIGYTPKFSIDTMRVIEDDKVALDAVFFGYGLQGDVEIEIQKLNATGTAYEYDSTFAIDFESYDVQDEFSEFALKSVSVIDKYNEGKNTEIQIPLTHDATLPNTQKYINYVSLKSLSVIEDSSTMFGFNFEHNNESKIYDGDLSLFPEPYEFYTIAEASTVTLRLSFSGSFKFSSAMGGFAFLRIFKNVPIFANAIHTFNSFTFLSGVNEINISENEIVLTETFAAGDILILYLMPSVPISVTGYVQNVFLDLKKQTILNVVGENTKVKFAYTSEILDSIFNGQASYQQIPVLGSALTSASHLTMLNNFATLKPKEFLSDFCKAAGLVVNFKLDGDVWINSIGDYFDGLLDIDNAIEITDFKDLSIRHTTELNFASVSAGQEISEYDVYTYLIDWNKVLTFNQSGRNASENLDLTLSKLRADFSGILDAYFKRSQQKNSARKDNFLFNPLFDVVWIDDDEVYYYDGFNPRYILNNWTKFLSFCFQNFGMNTLTISSNGGTVDNLQISGVNQMDNISINSTPRLLPLEYNLTGLIPNIDFSEKILKINYDGEDIYLFVTEAETTDKLTEQKIKGLKIQF